MTHVPEQGDRRPSRVIVTTLIVGVALIVGGVLVALATLHHQHGNPGPTPTYTVQPVVITSTAPGGRVTTTTTRPRATTTVGVPQVSTVFIPGSTVTVIRVRTVTRTVAPPPCDKHLVFPCVLR